MVLKNKKTERSEEFFKSKKSVKKEREARKTAAHRKIVAGGRAAQRPRSTSAQMIHLFR